MSNQASSSEARQWFIALRWQEYLGEGRANLLRIAAVALFYSIHLLHYRSFRLGPLELGEGPPMEAFHRAVTALAVAWTMLALGVQAALRQRVFPGWLKYLSTAGDVVLLTAVLAIGDGPKAPLVVGYFLILLIATLRLNLPLVRFATGASLVGYLVLLGLAKWPETFGRGPVDLRVPRYEQLIFLAALVLAGVLLGQVLRQMRGLADEVLARIEGTKIGTDRSGNE